MGKRVSKYTRLIVDVTEAIKSQGVTFANGSVVELELVVHHSKTQPVQDAFIKNVRLDLTQKAFENEAVV